MGAILDGITQPADLKDLTYPELIRLARELREEITRVVSANGGHLASNLGVVELTIALHRVFDFRTDALVWDVGHQTYAHKLLTGRRDRFHTLRQHGGMSGYPDKRESPYDLFITGHTGTAISSALGLVCADELLGRSRNVVAVIGDGSLTNGLTLEALNHAGSLGKKLLVVLNDNRMSISATVGAIAQYLDRFRSARFYNRAKWEIRRFVTSLPGVGTRLESALGHIKEGVKATVLHETLFDQLGFRSFGPLDGHRLDDLIEMLEAVKDLDGPVLLHVVTEKGRGCAPAAGDPSRYHSAPPKRPPAEKPQASRPTYTRVFARKLCELAERNTDIVAITAAMEEGTGLAEFADRFPDRFFDVGICESHAVAFGGAASASGLKPVIAIYSTFLQRAYDQVFHDLCLQGLGAVLCLDRAGVVGADGPTHHGVFDISYLRHIPGLVVAAPRDGDELEALLGAAVASDAPWAIRFPKDRVPAVSWPHREPVEPGRAEVLREGRDAVIVAYGSMVAPAWEAARMLAQAGLSVGVVNARFAKPLDVDRLRSVAASTPVVFTVEEHVLAGGFGSAVLEALSAEGPLPCRLERIGLPDRFIEHGPREVLLDTLGLTARGLAHRVTSVVSGEPRPERPSHAIQERG